MTDFDDECDATLKSAQDTLAHSAELAEQCRKVLQVRQEWESANGIGPEKRQRFFAALSPENQKVVEEENERFNRELVHDLDRIAPAPSKKAPVRMRNYM